MKAKLTVRLTNGWGCYLSAVHENRSSPPIHRVVQIDLTAEQVARVMPAQCGENRGKPVMEEYEVIALEFDAAEGGGE